MKNCNYLLLSIISLVIFISCGKAEDKVSLKIMLQAEDPNRQIIYQEYYKDKINDAFPNYDIQFELPGSGTAYNSKLSVYNASETLPDVFWGQELVYISDSIMPLTDKIKENGFYDKYINKNGLIPALDGEIYALSPGTDAFFAGPIFYNKDMLDEMGLEIPTNYDEFLQLVKDLRANGVIPISIVKFAYQNFLISDLMTVDDPDAMGKLQRGEITFEDPLYLNAVKRFDELVKAGAFPNDVVTLEQQPHEELFTSGKAAMIYHPLWVWAAIKDAPFEIDFLYLPEVFGAKNVVNAWGSAYNGFVVSKNTKYPKEALEVAQWLAMQDAKYWFEVAGNATAIDGYNVLSENSPEVNKYFYDKITNENTVVYPCHTLNFISTSQLVDYMNELDKLVVGQITPNEFVEKYTEIVNN